MMNEVPAKPIPACKPGPPPAVPFTGEQLRAIWSRISEIHAHFDACCAFQMDKCHYGEEYNQMYSLLHLAGVPDTLTPFEQADFDEWCERLADDGR